LKRLKITKKVIYAMRIQKRLKVSTPIDIMPLQARILSERDYTIMHTRPPPARIESTPQLFTTMISTMDPTKSSDGLNAGFITTAKLYNQGFRRSQRRFFYR
jgi:hypothetical protein